MPVETTLFSTTAHRSVKKTQLEHFVMDGRADQRDCRWPRCAPKHGEVAGKLWKKSKNMEPYSKSRKYRCKESHPSTVQILVWLLQTVWPVRRQNSTVQIPNTEASWHCTTLQEGSAGQLLVRSCSCRRCQVRHQRFRFVFQLGAVKFSHAVQRHCVAEPISWVRKLESQGESVEFGKSNLKFGLCVPISAPFCQIYPKSPRWCAMNFTSWFIMSNYHQISRIISTIISSLANWDITYRRHCLLARPTNMRPTNFSHIQQPWLYALRICDKSRTMDSQSCNDMCFTKQRQQQHFSNQVHNWEVYELALLVADHRRPALKKNIHFFLF